MMRGSRFFSKYLLRVLTGAVSLVLTSCGTYAVEGRYEGPAWTACGWMELPQMDPEDHSLGFFSHRMQTGGSRERNYSFYWDYADRVSLWVAYPLCQSNIGAPVGRSEAYGFDPLLPAREQSDVTRGFSGGSGGIRYDRGHQIPSADRQGSYANNATTFYSTNMTPQANAFNTGLWANLEGSVRKWASKSDTLYVATGCVVGKGMKKFVTDASDNRVAVPVAYWKALLRYDGSAGSGYSACAFYFDHSEYGSGAKAALRVSSSLSITVAELEEILGYRLFVNLDRQVGKAESLRIREEDPSQVDWWWEK